MSLWRRFTIFRHRFARVCQLHIAFTCRGVPCRITLGNVLAVLLVLVSFFSLHALSLRYPLRTFTTGRRLYAAFIDSDVTIAQDTMLQLLPEHIQDRPKEFTVVILGLCRDNEQMLPRTMASLHKIGKLFKNYQILILENDSVDQTPALLRQLAREDDHVHALSLQLYDDTLPFQFGEKSKRRTYAMAKLRNRLVDMMRAAPYNTADYAIVVDMDLVTLPAERAIQAAFRLNFDVVCAHGINWHVHLFGGRRHYDDFAIQDMAGNRVRYACSTCGEPAIDPLELGPETPALRLQSCFGGFAIYNRSIFDHCKYSGDDCEHLSFHMCAIDHGYEQIYLDPHMVLVR
ncbi:uncharacterized protein MONBRDRAFT_24295 [Monosiga brevicollis MX1]|uniref:Uncharacterized protein n=1 Tax=Monosiga brevicollis TaxID=81824 RepID=A9UVZ8_MONBE|nr:uncharacterized protein MONBRDRAFT_24295 [Monosiga brevicollis MX1]EDQ90679.1 predicted protein [Monosiga brevicollis MX1]|eukprot:XP_001744730.1 hypothetical protein [Monosiga brevicollis MX1]